MFHNVGKTIKGIAVATFAVLCASAFISGIVLMASDEDLIGYGFLTWIVGPLVAFIDACFIYGFGEIVDTAIINRKEEKQEYPVKVPVVSQPKPITPTAPQPKPKTTVAYPAPVQRAEPPKKAVSSKVASEYIGKKWCSGCGEVLSLDVTECPVCGSVYLGTITKLNVENVLANLPEDTTEKVEQAEESIPICKCGAIPERVGNKYVCPECSREFR